MEEIRLNYNDLAPYVIAANALMGLLFGIFPLLAGLVLKNRKYGVFGLVSAVIGGAILGIFLSFPVALVFFWLIVRRTPAAVTTESSTSTAGSDAESENTLV